MATISLNAYEDAERTLAGIEARRGVVVHGTVAAEGATTGTGSVPRRLRGPGPDPTGRGPSFSRRLTQSEAAVAGTAPAAS